MFVNRKISPPLSELDNLRQKLEPGEMALLDALNSHLPPIWEIYIQPHLNGLCPDFVILNPLVGIVVIEVKDWDFTAMDYRWRENRPACAKKSLLATKDGRTFPVENPIDKAKLYASEILNLYCPSVGVSFSHSPVTSSVVFFSKLSTQEAKYFVKEDFQKSNTGDDVIDRYYPSIGHDGLGAEIIDLVPFFKMTHSKFMREEYASDLRLWLEEPRAKIDQRTPLSLSKDQERLVKKEKTINGFRRIRGSAGSGKSLILAKKAANLALEGKKVLILTFNITICNYLADLAVRAALPKTGVRNKIDFLNYHSWAKRVCILTGYAWAYEALEWDKKAEEVLNSDLPKLVNSILQNGCPSELEYDAVLVDEGQDFRLLWWQSLVHIVKTDGEAVLVADKTQDIYETAGVWTDDVMQKAGFRGSWGELKVSYRLPPDYLPYIKNFLQQYFKDGSKIDPLPLQANFDNLQQTHMRWLQVNPDDSVNACVNAVLALPLRKSVNDSLVYPDIVVLAETNKDGFQIVRKLGSKGIKVKHTFGLSGDGKDDDKMRKQKVAFYLGAEQVKATTIHSFKGWESTCLVIQISSSISKRALAGVYTALTRLKASERGEDSYITVICSALELEDYGKTWPGYEKLCIEQC